MSEILIDLKDDLIPLKHQQAVEGDLFYNEENPTIDNFGNYVRDIPWSWQEFYKYLSLSGLHNSSGFHFEIGDAEPVEDQTPKYRNFEVYASEIGRDSFKKECDD